MRGAVVRPAKLEVGRTPDPYDDGFSFPSGSVPWPRTRRRVMPFLPAPTAGSDDCGSALRSGARYSAGSNATCPASGGASPSCVASGASSARVDRRSSSARTNSSRTVGLLQRRARLIEGQRELGHARALPHLDQQHPDHEVPRAATARVGRRADPARATSEEHGRTWDSCGLPPEGPEPGAAGPGIGAPLRLGRFHHPARQLVPGRGGTRRLRMPLRHRPGRAQRLFDPAILTGVISERDHDASRAHGRGQPRQRLLEVRGLVVDPDAQRLEHLRGTARMRAAAERAIDQRGERTGRGDFPRRAAATIARARPTAPATSPCSRRIRSRTSAGTAARRSDAGTPRSGSSRRSSAAS